MTQNEIIELAEQAGFERIKHTNEDWVCFSEEIEAFAALVAAHERERIEKAWGKLYGWWESDDETKTRGTT